MPTYIEIVKKYGLTDEQKDQLIALLELTIQKPTIKRIHVNVNGPLSRADPVVREAFLECCREVGLVIEI